MSSSFYPILFQGTFELKRHESIESVEAAKIKDDKVYLDISIAYWFFSNAKFVLI